MNFKSFKKHLNKTSLVCFILFIAAIIVGIAIVGSGYNHNNSKYSVQRLALIIIDGFLMSFFIWLIHELSGFGSMAYVITKKSYITEDTKTTITKFNNPWWLHLLTAVFLIAIYFLSVTGMMHAYNNDWKATIKGEWWICLIISIVNFLIFEVAYNTNLYQFNHDPKIVNEI